MIDLYLIDDHTIFLEGVANLLEQEAWIGSIYRFNDPADFFESQAMIQTDMDKSIFILDINFNQLLNGVDICKELKTTFPDCKVLALSMHDEYHYINGMISAKADGYILKNESIDVILEGLKAVNEGHEFFLSPLSKKIVEDSTKQTEVLWSLNPKEKKILALVLEGKTNREVGQLLECSYKTVEYSKNGLFLKFNVKNVKELIKNVSTGHV